MRAMTPLGLIITAAVLTACSDTSGPDVPRPPSLVLTVAPSSATIEGGRTLRLAARLVGEAGEVTTPPDVSWSSSDAVVAGVGLGGLVEGRKPGEARILASWGSARGSAMVTVVRPPKETPGNPTCPAVLHEAETNLIPVQEC